MFESLKPSEFRAEPSASGVSAGAPWPLEHRWLASSPADLVAPVQSGHRRARLAIAALAAVLVHGAAFAALYVATLNEIERLGAGGVELEAVSVEMISQSDIAPARASERIDEVPPAASGRTAPAPAPAALPADQASAEAAAATPPPVLAVEAPALITVDLSLAPAKRVGVGDANSTAELQDSRLRAPMRRDETLEPPDSAKPLAAAHAEPIADGAAGSAGGAPVTTASVAAGTSAPAVSPGAARQYAKSVAEALGRTTPEPGTLGGVRGTVKLAFAIAPDGRLEALRVVRSSGTAKIDATAIEAVKAARFPPPPPGLSLAQRSYEIPYVFR